MMMVDEEAALAVLGVIQSVLTVAFPNIFPSHGTAERALGVRPN
jgi:hypothetical protein